MAETDVVDNGIANVRINLKKNQVISAADNTAFQNVSTMKTALLAAGYTAANLKSMDKNDLIFALRKVRNLNGV